MRTHVLKMATAIYFANSDKERLQQTQVNDHFEKAQPESKPEPYSDELFKEAAIQWLVETDQVCITLSFLQMYNLTQSFFI